MTTKLQELRVIVEKYKNSLDFFADTSKTDDEKSKWKPAQEKLLEILRKNKVFISKSTGQYFVIVAGEVHFLDSDLVYTITELEELMNLPVAEQQKIHQAKFLFEGTIKKTTGGTKKNDK